MRKFTVQLHTSADNVTLLAFAAERRAAAAAAIDRYLLPAGRTAANPLQRSIDRTGTDRGTDTQTDTVPSHRPCRILREQCRGRIQEYALGGRPLPSPWK